MDKRRTEVAAAVDIGSHATRMMVVQWGRDGVPQIIEDLWKTSRLGHDAFSHGRVGQAAIDELCETLRGFRRVMNDNGVTRSRLVATSGLREASNREYVREQVRCETGFDIEVINHAQERYYIYKAVREYISWENTARGTLLVDIGAGGVEISAYIHGKLEFYEYVKVGVLRLRELLSALERMTTDFPGLIEEFVDSRIDFLEGPLHKLNIHQVVGLGGERRMMQEMDRLLSPSGTAGDEAISRAGLAHLEKTFREMTTEQAVARYKLERSRADLLFPSILLFRKFLGMTRADRMLCPNISLRHGVLADMLDDSVESTRRERTRQDVLASVRYVAGKYGCDDDHSAFIAELCRTIFDGTTRLHRLNDRDRLCLEAAAFLHDVGKSVHLTAHDVHGYNILRYQDILGFSNREVELVANIARYHSEQEPSLDDANYAQLQPEDRIRVSKMAAILRLAEAMDLSHRRKIEQLTFRFTDDGVVEFLTVAEQDMILETWHFDKCASLFSDVTGWVPRLIRKKP